MTRCAAEKSDLLQNSPVMQAVNVASECSALSVIRWKGSRRKAGSADGKAVSENEENCVAIHKWSITYVDQPDDRQRVAQLSLDED